MKPKSLFTRLLLSHTVIIMVTLIVLGGMFNYLLQHYLTKSRQNLFERVSKTAANNRLIKAAIAQNDPWTLSVLVKQVSQSTEADVIVVDTNGNVLSSTASGLADNILDSQEVKYVLTGQMYSHWGGTFLGVPSLTVGYPVEAKNHQIIGAIFLNTSIKGFQASLFNFRLSIFYAALLALVLSAILAYILAKGISRPILEMNTAAKSLASGADTTEVSYSGKDELGSLVSVFNHALRETKNTMLQQQRLEAQRREFVANVSHEFRAPVTSLQGFLELMQDGVIPETDRPRYYALMLKDTARLARLVNDLLDLARFQAGQGQLNASPLEPELIVDEVIAKLIPRAVEHNIKLVKSGFPNRTLILADGDRLEQILINLLDNAIRFTPDGGKVEVEIVSEAEQTIFNVRDSGSGIPEEDLPHVFERFYKADKARTPEKGGTGLGLAIVKELVEAHGGNISVESRPREGSVFRFTIPNA